MVMILIDTEAICSYFVLLFERAGRQIPANGNLRAFGSEGAAIGRGGGEVRKTQKRITGVK
jgi:hypothetical protein